MHPCALIRDILPPNLSTRALTHFSLRTSIRTISWNPTGHLIATGSQDRTLRIWNPDKPQLKNSTELRGHTGAIERVAWNPTKEAELASVSTDGTVRFWDVRSKACIESVQLGARGLSLSWAPDGRMVMAGKGERAVSHFLLTGQYEGRIEAYRRNRKKRRSSRYQYRPLQSTLRYRSTCKPTQPSLRLWRPARRIILSS